MFLRGLIDSHREISCIIRLHALINACAYVKEERDTRAFYMHMHLYTYKIIYISNVIESILATRKSENLRVA